MTPQLGALTTLEDSFGSQYPQWALIATYN